MRIRKSKTELPPMVEVLVHSWARTLGLTRSGKSAKVRSYAYTCIYIYTKLSHAFHRFDSMVSWRLQPICDIRVLFFAPSCGGNRANGHRPYSSQSRNWACNQFLKTPERLETRPRFDTATIREIDSESLWRNFNDPSNCFRCGFLTLTTYQRMLTIQTNT